MKETLETNTARFNLEQLLKPISEENPCGADLDQMEFDAEYFALAQQLPLKELGYEDLTTGEENDPLKEISWLNTHTICASVFSRYKSLRVINYWILALMHDDGLVGLWRGLKLIDALLEQYWNDVEPLLEDAAGQSVKTRVYVMQDLQGPLLMRMLDNVCLWDGRGRGKVTVRAILLANGYYKISNVNEETESDLNLGAISDLLQSADVEELSKCYQALLESVDLLKAFEKRFQKELSTSLDLGGLVKRVDSIAVTLSELVPALNLDAEEEDGETEASQGKSKEKIDNGVITDRNNVILTLDRVLKYYDKYEPSSPVLPLLKRAKHWVNMDFMSIVKEISPQGATEVEKVLKTEITNQTGEQ